MAPKKSVAKRGAVQEHGDFWRVEVSGLGKGLASSLYADAANGLVAARLASSREEMRQVLHQLVLGNHTHDLVGQPLAAIRDGSRERKRSR